MYSYGFARLCYQAQILSRSSCLISLSHSIITTGNSTSSTIAVKHPLFLTAIHKIAMHNHLQKRADSNFDSNASNAQLSVIILSEQQAIDFWKGYTSINSSGQDQESPPFENHIMQKGQPQQRVWQLIDSLTHHIGEYSNALSKQNDQNLSTRWDQEDSYEQFWSTPSFEI